jgi:hypothetical protein
MKKIFLVIPAIIILVACNKQNLSEPKADIIHIENTSAISQDHPLPSVTYPFSFQSSGPFTIIPVSATVVKINQELSISSASPFPLIGGVVQGFDDLTIPTFPDRFFNGSFRYFGQGNDSLFATVTVQTSVFSDPIDPATGDFFGSEDFTGTFQFTGGTGRYLNATGSGTYTAHSEWRPPTIPGTFFSGFTTVTATGTISTVARNGELESQAQ